MSTPPPNTGPPTRVVSTAAASDATATPSPGAPTQRLGGTAYSNPPGMKGTLTRSQTTGGPES